LVTQEALKREQERKLARAQEAEERKKKAREDAMLAKEEEKKKKKEEQERKKELSDAAASRRQRIKEARDASVDGEREPMNHCNHCGVMWDAWLDVGLDGSEWLGSSTCPLW